MEALSQTLPIIIYFLLIVLLIIAIVIGIKLITTMNKVDKLVEDVNEKLESLNNIFNMAEYISGKMSAISETIIGVITTAISKIFKKFNKESEIDE